MSCCTCCLNGNVTCSLARRVCRSPDMFNDVEVIDQPSAFHVEEGSEIDVSISKAYLKDVDDSSHKVPHYMVVSEVRRRYHVLLANAVFFEFRVHDVMFRSDTDHWHRKSWRSPCQVRVHTCIRCFCMVVKSYHVDFCLAFDNADIATCTVSTLG